MTNSETFDTATPDKQLLFDVDPKSLQLVTGEKAFYQTRNVVDIFQTKNFADDDYQGSMTVTNLRVIFSLDEKPSTNISIGLNCIFKILAGNVDL